MKSLIVASLLVLSTVAFAKAPAPAPAAHGSNPNGHGAPQVGPSYDAKNPPCIIPFLCK